MINDKPKIAFAYATFVREGMSVAGPFTPNLGLQVDKFPFDLKFYVTAGLILNSQRAYSFDVDVFYDGQSLIPDFVPAIDTKLMGTAVSSRDDFIAISTTLLSDVTVKEEGLYTIKVLLYSGGAESSDRNLIETYECFFVLAKNWLPTSMTKKS